MTKILATYPEPASPMDRQLMEAAIKSLEATADGAGSVLRIGGNAKARWTMQTKCGLPAYTLTLSDGVAKVRNIFNLSELVDRSLPIRMAFLWADFSQNASPK